MADHIISSAPMAAAAQRPASGVAAGTQSKARMELFMLVRILFQYLERVDQRVLDLAKEVSLHGLAASGFCSLPLQ